MTDLCKNCGCCHLGVDPIPCGQALQFCGTCKQGGHTPNFCPLGVYQPNGQLGPLYFMICSNCDRWHLPAPCQVPLQLCRQCGHHGHMAHYCPVNPIPIRPLRELAQPQPPLQDAGSCRKRKRQDGNDKEHLVVKLPLRVLDLQHVHPTLVKQIQLEMWASFTRMLVDHAREDVLAMLTHGVPLPSAGDHLATGALPATANAGLRAGTLPPTTLIHTQTEGNSMLQSFTQQPSSRMPPSSSDYPEIKQAGGGIPVTPVTVQKHRKATRCEECKHTHAKCSHHTNGTEQEEESYTQGKANVQTSRHVGPAGLLRETFGADVFTGRPSLLDFQTADSGAAGQDFPAQDPLQQPTWLLNTDVPDLNALASAAAQITSQSEQASFDFAGHSQSLPEGGQNEDSVDPMGFSNLLNSDSASAPVQGTAQDDQPAQLETQLQEAVDAKPQKKRGGRKKKT